MKTLRSTLAVPVAILAAASSLAAETPLGTSPGSTPVAPAPAAGNPTADGVPELETVRAPYQRNIASLHTARDTHIAGVTKSYVTSLERLQREITARGELEGAIQVKAELERIAGGKEPAVAERKLMPAALVALRHQFENECSPILASARQQEEQLTKSYLVVLDTLQKRLTVENKLEKALIVKAERDKAPAAPAPSKVELTKRELEKKVEGMTYMTDANFWLKKYTFGKGKVTINPDKDGKGRTQPFHALDGATIAYPWEGGDDHKLIFAPDLSSCDLGSIKYKKQ